ncbi:hypothetical protein [Nocardia crassostreae]|uniref:hypothetical protein n=1 Tax=Nocardia crassostreae TaxID=53428 RepID=UPI0012F7F20D|nr:hypothetical protein [Nocardia crassostreae]
MGSQPGAVFAGFVIGRLLGAGGVGATVSARSSPISASPAPSTTPPPSPVSPPAPQAPAVVPQTRVHQFPG